MYIIQKKENPNSNILIYISYIWLFNPLILTVSSRGNSESFLSIFILLTIYFLKCQNLILAGIMFGLSVHIKLYPVIYSFPIYFYLCQTMKFFHCIKPNRSHFKFGISVSVTCTLISTLFYLIYGWDFLYNSYFYHLHRVDIKHNFSVYFYAQYLLTNSHILKLFGMVLFVPQCILLVVLSWQHRKNVIFNMLLCTIVFVAFNKVATSQYFMWHLFLLPNAISDIPFRKLIPLILSYIAWFSCQSIWLYFAYKLEFEGRQVFIFVWLASILFLISHVVKIKTLIKLIANINVKNKVS